MNNVNMHRKDYLSLGSIFYGVAKLSAMRSKDPSTQVEACIVGSDNGILSIGYNCTPNGFDACGIKYGHIEPSGNDVKLAL